MSSPDLRLSAKCPSSSLGPPSNQERDITVLHTMHQIPHHDAQVPCALSRESLVVASVAIIAIMVPLLNTPVADTTLAVLACGILFELLGLLFLITLPMPSPRPANVNRLLRTSMALVVFSSAYTIPISMGILGLSAAIVMEYVKVSVTLAMGMTCILVIGGVLCILAWVLKAFGRV